MKLNYSSLISMTALSSALFAVGCSSVPQSEIDKALDAQKSEYQKEMSAQRSQYEKQISALKSEKSSLTERAVTAENSSKVLSSTPKATTVASVNSELFPPNAQPGQCWSRVLTPAKYTTNTQSVLVTPASEDVSILPAKYAAGSERILVKEASTKIVPVAATYKTVKESVLVKPAHTHLTTIPAVYDVVTERVLDKPAHTAWKRGEGFRSSALETRINNGTGEIMCLVEVPATYKTLSKKVLKTPEQVVEEVHPAEYKTVTTRVLDKPATTKVIQIPAEYRTVDVQRLVTPEKQVRKAIPAVYKNVTSSVKVSDEVLAWEEVLCEVNMTKQNVLQVQRSLKKAGTYSGPIDGVYGPLTERAANSYAKKHGLPGGSRLISLKTVKHLGLLI